MGNVHNSDKRAKLQVYEEEIKEDCISNLPDSLLLHIISFLPTKSAVQTGVLSRRWKDLWTQTDCLDFSFGCLPSIAKYVAFVETSLSLHRSSRVRKFQCELLCDTRYSQPFHSWVDFALSKRVEELDIFSLRGEYELPVSLYNYVLLRSLKLEWCSVKLSCFKDLRLLRSLCLSYIGLEDASLSRLLSECPLLEDLCLRSCFGLDHLCIPSSCLQLKFLEISACEVHCGLEIHVPNLISLKFSGAIDRADYYFKVSSRPEIVLLDFCKDGVRMESVGGPCYTLARLIEEKFLMRVLEDVRIAKVLCLSSSCVQLLSGQDLQRHHTHFHKLKCLELEARLEIHQLEGMASLLRNSPALEALTLRIKSTESIDSDARSARTFWESQQWHFPCLIHSLKSVRIIISRENSVAQNNAKMMRNLLKKWANEIKLVGFFLRNAMILEIMTIRVVTEVCGQMTVRNLDPFDEIHQMLDALPRASSLVEISFGIEGIETVVSSG